MNKNGFFTGLIILVVLLVVGFFWFSSQMDGDEVEGCVPASCCHAAECVWESDAPNCSGRICTMDCRAGTIDCGQGQCEVVGGACEVVWNE